MGATAAQTAPESGRLQGPLQAIVTQPVIVLYGARHIGKDTITTALRAVNPGIEKVETDAVWRRPREGESLALAPGVNEITIDQLMDSQNPNRYVVWYAEENVLYAVPERSFKPDKIPVLHVVGPRGVEQLERGTLPNKLNVLITFDQTKKDAAYTDIQNRVFNRLVASNEFASDLDLRKATRDQRERVRERSEYTRDRIAYFEGQKFVNFDAIYANNVPLENDVRRLINKRVRDRDIVVDDIAHRIDALYKRFTEKLKTLHSPQINAADLHHEYIEDCCKHLFGKELKKLRQNNQLADTVSVAALQYYADEHGLTETGVRGLIEQTKLQEFIAPKNTGKVYLYLNSAGRSILVSEIQRDVPSESYHVLGVIARAIYEETKTQPRYVVDKGIVKGLVFSLTDSLTDNRRPYGQRTRQRHELFIGYR